MESFVDTYLEFMEFVDQIVRKFLIAVTAAMTLTIIVQVLFRYILKDPLIWTEELARYLMIWMAFVGASCVIKKWQNIYVDFFIDKLASRRRRIAYFVQKLIVFSVLLYTLLLAAEVIPAVAGNQVTAAMGVNMMWAQSSIIAGLLLMVLQNLGVLLDDLFNAKVFGKEGEQ
ncbi:TRAP transporter small permease [Xanthobacteraceae bacterium Astr-EGSB]|uniref:TRAP transporter small permease n=1 Tax=Astrobacterium formosum TaxID=3069710 RepID=UPI0027B38AD5|nr:TRAP transporter small permease [Xanthobacteraceae bacterium Astr-EGSB]